MLFNLHILMPNTLKVSENLKILCIFLPETCKLNIYTLKFGFFFNLSAMLDAILDFSARHHFANLCRQFHILRTLLNILIYYTFVTPDDEVPVPPKNRNFFAHCHPSELPTLLPDIATHNTRKL